MMGLRLVFRGDDLLSCHPSLHGHYPLRRYYDDSDFCQPPRDVPALADLLCSRHHPCLTYDHQPPQHSPAQVPYLHALVRRLTRRGFAFHSQARRFALAESCSLSLSSVRFFSLLSTPPRGDAVTSSSHPEHGSRWPGSLTPEDRDASQRTRGIILIPGLGWVRVSGSVWDQDDPTPEGARQRRLEDQPPYPRQAFASTALPARALE